MHATTALNEAALAAALTGQPDRCEALPPNCPAAVPTSAKRILLADDEIHILRAAEFKFRRAGFEVRTASDGEEAWQAICQSRPDILITDCQMPRLSGLDLCRRIMQHDHTRGLPVLMLTAKGFEMRGADLTREYGILAIVAKPFSPRDLLQRVEQYLQAPSPL